MNKRYVLGVFILLALILGVWAAYRYWPQSPTPTAHLHLQDAQNKPDHVSIYFSRLQKGVAHTDPVLRPLSSTESDQDLITNATTQLLKGPTRAEKQQGYFSEIPAGTRFLSLRKGRRGWILNLSERFGEGGGATSMTQRVAQLAKTLTSLPQKRPVFLQMEGTSVDVLGGEGVMIHEPITEDSSVSQ